MTRHFLSRRQFLGGGIALAATTLGVPPTLAKGNNGWRDSVSFGPFLCQADFDLAPYRGLFKELFDLQKELIRTLAITPAKTPIELYLFANRENHVAYLTRRFPGVPYRRALFVKTGKTSRVFAYQTPELPIDVRHECTHALLHASQPMVPLWLDEGLAEYFELPIGKRAFDNPHLETLRWNMRLGMIPTLQSLEKKKTLAEMGNMEYRFSWAWAHFMLHGPREAHRELVRFLYDIRRHNPPGLLSARLANVIPNLETQMVRHFKHWKRP